MSIVSSIARTVLFRGLDAAALQRLAGQCRERSLPKGRELFAMGDRADAFFVICDGWMKLYRLSRDGNESIIHVFGPGESFAEAAAFSERRVYPANAQAVEECRLIQIPYTAVVRRIEEDGRFALHMLGTIARRQHLLVQRIEQLTARTAPQRLGTFLLRFCRPGKGAGGWIVDLPFDKSVISTRLNIKPETFSRALAKLKPYGVHPRGHRRIVVTDPGRLADFCDVPQWEGSGAGAWSFECRPRRRAEC